MNKQELIKAIAADAGVTQTAALAVINAFEGNVIEALADGDTVKIVGLGTFKTSNNAARMARNPKAGEPVAVPAKRRVIFVAGKELRDMVNTPYEFRP